MATDRIQLQVLRSKDVLSGSTADLEVAKHFDGVTSPKLPTSEQLEFGEIALNIAKGYEVISIKNYDGEIIYLPFNIAQRLLDTNVSLDDLKEHTINTIESFSADTIVRFDSVYDYINRTNTQLSNTIQESNNTLSERIENVGETLTTTIESFSADTQSKLNDIEFRIQSGATSGFSGTIGSLVERIDLVDSKVEDVKNNLHNEITSVSGDILSQVDVVEEELLNNLNDLSGNIQTLSESLDDISASTESKIDHLKLIDLKDVEVSASTITDNEFNVAVYEDNKLKTKIIGGFDKMAVISDEDIEDGVTDGPVVGVVNATYAVQAMYDSEGHTIATIFSVASALESRITELEKLVVRLAECERRLDDAESKLQLLENNIG